MNGHRPCDCETLAHRLQLVVVTGGPSAGKTAVLEVARKSFCEHVVIVPEAAGIVFGGGFWRRDTVPARQAAQRAIFHVQRELERLVLEEGKAAVALCDRGTLDGLAYWPDGRDEFCQQVGIDRKQEMARYSAVIHLRTPALDQGYNWKNPLRIESAQEAALIDGRIEKAWEGHPNRELIESGADFMTKAQRAMALIRRVVPACCEKRSK